MLVGLIETQKWCLPTSAGRERVRLNKETMDFASTSAWEKAAPPALALKPENSVPPSMSLAPFKLLSHCLEPRASESS